MHDGAILNAVVMTHARDGIYLADDHREQRQHLFGVGNLIDLAVFKSQVILGDAMALLNDFKQLALHILRRLQRADATAIGGAGAGGAKVRGGRAGISGRHLDGLDGHIQLLSHDLLHDIADTRAKLRHAGGDIHSTQTRDGHGGVGGLAARIGVAGGAYADATALFAIGRHPGGHTPALPALRPMTGLRGLAHQILPVGGVIVLPGMHR